MDSPHRPALEALGLPHAAAGQLAAYLDRLAAWNARVNLTAARTPAERVRILVGPVLPLAPLPERGPLLDIGSGNGSPGFVLGVLRPDLETTLLEPRLRRWAFLAEAARALGEPRIRVLRQRHEDYAGPRAHTLTVRGLKISLGALARLVEPGGQLLISDPAPRAAEGWLQREPSPPGFRCYRRQHVPRET